MNENIKIAAGYVLICILWGSTWLVIRLGLDSLTPVLSAGLRFSLASVLIFLLMKVNGIKLQTDRTSIKLYIMLGFLSFVIPFGLVYWAEQFVPSGLASVLFGIMPFGVILFSRLMIIQRIGPYQTAGVVLGFAGLVTIFSENLSFDFSEGFWGMAAVVASATIQAYIAVKIKKSGQHLNPLSMNFIPLIIAGITMSLYGLFFEDMSRVTFNLNAIFSISYLAMFGTVATFTTYYWLMKRIDVVILSISAFITPIVAVILGWFVLDENLSMRDLTGSAMVLMGILFANFRGLRNYYLRKKQLAE